MGIDKLVSRPLGYYDNDDIRVVASPFAASPNGIVSSVISMELKNLLLQRFENEISSKIDGRYIEQTASNRGTNVNVTLKRKRPYGRSSQEEKIRKREGQESPNKVGDIGILENQSSGASKSLGKSTDILELRKKGGASCRNTPKNMNVSTINGQSDHVAEISVRSRFIVGINKCTRILEKALKSRKTLIEPTKTAAPLLVILSRDIRPANIIAHIPVIAQLLDIPLLVLPGKAAFELGEAVGLRSVAMAVFLPLNEAKCPVNSKESSVSNIEWRKHHRDIDSFIKFVITNIPK